MVGAHFKSVVLVAILIGAAFSLPSRGASADDDVIIATSLARCDQARLSAAFLRYATKPRPQNPRIIIAQVEGSGTAAT